MQTRKIKITGLSIQALVFAGGYTGWVDPAISEKNFPTQKENIGEWETQIFALISNTSTVTIERMSSQAGWILATMEHMLTYGAKYPDEQRNGRIVGLHHSPYSLSHDIGMPVLYTAGKDRGVSLAVCEREWSVNYRFLAVRRTS